jgi:ectoine hydroxylase-related dioxygenase (phytanoyl-CoA dioxygenase family)
MWYVQDTPLEMGPTEVAPGKHTDGRTYTNADLDERDIWRRAIPAGSLLIFAHACWHRGALNQTDRPRDLITNAYARREIDKSHLTTKQPDGTVAYAPPPPDLLARLGPAVRDLLRA